MTFEDLEKINAGLKTTDIKGKDYVEVNSRIKGFRKLFPNGTISTEMVSLDNGVVIFKAIVLDENGHILGVGHAYEKEGSTFINKTSFIENAETSAVGRALGMLGIGIDVSVASYEEVANAVKNQDAGSGKNEPEPFNDIPFEITDHRAELKQFLEKKKVKGTDTEKKIVAECGLNKNSKDHDYEMALIYARNLLGE